MDKREGEGRQDNRDAVRSGNRRGEGFALSESEEKEVEQKLPPSVQVLHEAIRIQGDLEMSRSTSAFATRPSTGCATAASCRTSGS